MNSPILQPPAVDIPRHVWDAVNHAIHTSNINGSVQPISLCYVAVRAALAAYVARTPEPRELDPIDVACPQCSAKAGQRCHDWFIGVYEYTFHNMRIDSAKKAVQA